MKNLIITIALFYLFCFHCSAQTNPNLYDMPTAENVLLNIKGKDNIDTYAKQRAALYVLWDIAMFEMEKDYIFTDKPIKKVIADQKQEYNEAMRLVYQKYLKEINQPESQEVKDKWQKLWANYKFHTPNFKEELIVKLFDERTKNRYYDVTGKKKPVSSSNINVEIANSNLEVDKNDKLLKSEAAYLVGLDLFTGNKIKQSYEKAIDYFKDAANLGNSKALFFIGWMYSNGLGGLVQDYKIASEYYKKAELDKAALGVAYYDMGRIYFYGNGLEQNYQMALGYFSKASNLENSDSQYSLGYMYANGIYVNQNYNEAVLWFNKAAQQKNTKAYVYLGYMLVKGEGLKVNNEKALEFFKLAADNNNYEGKFYVGWMYANGKVINENYEYALPHYLSLIKEGINTLSEQNRIFVYKTILQIYKAQNKNNEALNFIKFVRENNLNDIDYDFIKLGVSVYLSSGNNNSAFQLLKEYDTLNPNNAEVLYNMGVLASEENKFTEAAEYYIKTIKLNPNYTNAYINMAALILDKEKSIIEEMNELGTSAEDNKRYDELNKVRKGIYSDAIPYLKKALLLDSKNKSTTTTLMNIYKVLGDTKNEAEMKKLLN